MDPDVRRRRARRTPEAWWRAAVAASFLARQRRGLRLLGCFWLSGRAACVINSGVATLVLDPLPSPLAHPPGAPPRRRKDERNDHLIFRGGVARFWGGRRARGGGAAGGLRRARSPLLRGLRLSTCARSGSARTVKRCAKTARACGARRAPPRRARARGALQCARRGRRATLRVPPLEAP